MIESYSDESSDSDGSYGISISNEDFESTFVLGSGPRDEEGISISARDYVSTFELREESFPFKPNGEFDDVDPKIAVVMDRLKSFVEKFHRMEHTQTDEGTDVSSLRGDTEASFDVRSTSRSTTIEIGGRNFSKSRMLRCETKTLTSAFTIGVRSHHVPPGVDMLPSSYSDRDRPTPVTGLTGEMMDPRKWGPNELEFARQYLRDRCLHLFHHPKMMFHGVKEVVEILCGNLRGCFLYFCAQLNIERSSQYVAVVVVVVVVHDNITYHTLTAGICGTEIKNIPFVTGYQVCTYIYVCGCGILGFSTSQLQD